MKDHNGFKYSVAWCTPEIVLAVVHKYLTNNNPVLAMRELTEYYTKLEMQNVVDKAIESYIEWKAKQ